MNSIALLMLLLGVGWVVKLYSTRHGKRELCDKVFDVFTKLLYNLFFPIMFYNIFADRGLNLADASITILVTVYVTLSILLLYPLLKNFNPRIRNPIILTSIFPNVVFLGFPVLLALYGDITYASLYSLVMLVYNITVGGLLGARRHEVFYAVVKLPILYGFMIGVIVHYTLPSIAVPTIMYTKTLSSIITTYGAALVLGYSLPATLSNMREYYTPTLIQGVYRFTVSPIIHYTLAILLALPDMAVKQLLAESIMPPALTNTILARVHGWDYEYTATSTLITTLASLIIVSVIAVLGLF